MPPKSRKRNANGGLKQPQTDIAAPAPTTPDKETWPGWCEVESEPAFFNTILHDIGVRGINVQEVLGLDDDCLAILPKPVYAMIFLFRYNEAGEEKQDTGCPPDVWFANQVPEYACASVALLNIVMNIADLELGSKLQQFKEFTFPLSPTCKGDEIATFDLVRKANNSFARDVDMLNIDAQLKEKHTTLMKKKKVEAAKLAKAAKAAERASWRPVEEDEEATTKDMNGNSIRPGPRSNPTRKVRAGKVAESPESSEEEGFHFVAYMPIGDKVWRLDGMDRSPKLVGQVTEGVDWLHVAQTELMARVLQYQEGQIEFSLMAFVKDPVIEDRHRLAENIRALQETHRRLDELSSEWGKFAPSNSDESIVFAPSDEYQVSAEDIENATVPQNITERLKTDSLEDLMQIRQEIIFAQTSSRAAIRDQMRMGQGDAVAAMHRRFDYTRFVNGWLNALVEEEALVELLERSNL